MNKISFYFVFCLLFFSFNVFSQENEISLEEKHSLIDIEQELLKKDYKKVIRLVDKAIDDGFESVKLYEKRSVAYYLTRNTKKAFLDIQEVVFTEEKDDLSYPILSLFFAQNKEEHNVIETLIGFYQKDNKNFLNAFSILSNKDAQKIITVIDSAFSKEDYPKKLHGVKSLINYSQKNYTDSYADLLKAIDIELGNGFLYYLFGEIKLRRQEYISSLASYNSAIEYGYNDIEVYKKRAVAKGFIEDFKGAIEDYNTIIEKDNKDFEIYYLRGIAKNYLKDYNGAIDDLNQSIKLNDSFPSSYNYRGIVYINIGDYGSALIDFYKTISLDPKHPFTHNNIGISYIKSGQNANAESFFTKAIELDPKHGDAYYNRAKIFFKKGDIKKAKSDLLRTLELNFENPDAHYHLALVYIQENAKSRRKNLDKMICQELETASNMNHPKAQELLKILCQKIEPGNEEEEE